MSSIAIEMEGCSDISRQCLFHNQSTMSGVSKMKIPKWEILIAIVLCIVFPFTLARYIDIGEKKSTNEPDITLKDPAYITVLFNDETVKKIPLQEYLVGVLLAEMPMSFHQEALCAQAVAARTVVMHGMHNGRKHVNVDICTNSACCQGYISPEEYQSKGGTGADLEKAMEAVAVTNDLVITYQGQLIEATYFSCSGGRTEDAVAVWGTDVPYLQSVDSPGEENATYFTEVKTFTVDNFRKCLSIANEKRLNVESITYTDGGSVEEIVISGKAFTGVQMRNLLGLKSTNFTIQVSANEVLITTKGFGHRVGMSQYGADAMGREGKNFREILTHYYTGTEVTEY